MWEPGMTPFSVGERQVRKAVEGVAEDIVVSSRLGGYAESPDAGDFHGGRAADSFWTGADVCRDTGQMFARMQGCYEMETLCIPVYVSGRLLDQVVEMQTRQNFRPGGR